MDEIKQPVLRLFIEWKKFHAWCSATAAKFRVIFHKNA